MSAKIEWTDATWNPVRGCSRISEGCRHCYAERQAARFSDPGQYAHGFVERREEGPRWTGRVELVESKLREPLSWRKPRRVFLNSMSDLFHEALPDEAIDRVFAVMALCPQHTFQVLTKRPERMRDYAAADRIGYIEHRARQIERESGRSIIPQGKTLAGTWPWPHVWLGVSVEDQASADERIPLLLDTPTEVRFVSAEPLLGPVDFRMGGASQPEYAPHRPRPPIDWVIAGGESGPGARPCDVAWIRSIVEQCREAGVPAFVKQLGANVRWNGCSNPGGHWPSGTETRDIVGGWSVRLKSAKGGDPSEWPEDLRVREFPREVPA